MLKRMIASVIGHRDLRTFGLILTVLVLTACVLRAQLQRALIAVAIFRAHIMTPPPAQDGASKVRIFGEEVHFFWDFANIPLARARRLNEIDPMLAPLVHEISRRQAAGENMQLPQHIYREVRWRTNFTPDVAATRVRIAALEQSLNERSTESALSGNTQDADGSWARGIDVWYLKLYYSVDKLQSCKGQTSKPLSYLDRINSPEALTNVLSTDLHDDFTRTGTFNREETDETFSAMARMLFPATPVTCFQFHPDLK